MKLVDKILRKIKYYLNPFNKSYSYSQEGEDLILKKIFNGKTNGFFIDVGAHHPKLFSNTYIFYKIGWNGINIDAMPGSMNAFKMIRPKDINLEIPISDISGKLNFYVFNEKALNTFSKVDAEIRNKENDYKITDVIEMNTRRLSEVLDEFLPQGKEIDFLSVDVEGFDLNVLQSNNWEKYRPKIILVEELNKDLEGALTGEIYNYLKSKNYSFVARSYNTCFYKDINSTL